jgi:hypothetical protein
MFAVLGILPFAPFFVATPRSMKAKNDKEDWQNWLYKNLNIYDKSHHGFKRLIWKFTIAILTLV